MLDLSTFGKKIKLLGFDFFAGVPCSFLNPLINYALNECEFIMSPTEADAVATASGAYIGGRKAVVLMQNSGLANAVSALTSLTFCFRIPLLGFVSLRGEVGLSDEPQHELMGQITTELLDCMRIPWAFLSPDEVEAQKQLENANKIIDKGSAFFFIVKKNTFEKIPLQLREMHAHQKGLREFSIPNIAGELPSRINALEALKKAAGDEPIYISTTGFSSRELYELGDTPNNLYMVGSMGCVSSLALGLALSRPDKKIIAIDGDGALVMRMGNIATNGYYAPKNLLHILLDNNCHDSTGGQFCSSCNVKFDELVAAANYENVVGANTLEDFSKAVARWKKDGGLTFIWLRTRKGAKDGLGRPSIKPYEVKERLMKHLG